MIPYRIKNQFTPPTPGKLRLGGMIADQMETFFSERVTSDYARDTILAECEEQFRLRNDDELPVGYWRGEFWGKWVISGCRVARYESDERLRETLHKTALALISTADPDGYIGTYRDKQNFFSPAPEKTKPVVGWACNWNWNLWCRKYTLWGMLEVYELTNDEKILDAAKKFTDQYMEMLGSMGVRPGETGTFNGLPTCSILKPMLILYRLTGEQRYLDFALRIADDWERPDGHIPNLISNALSMKPLHEWYPHSEKWAKAYEMMSCLDGLVELYRVTGVEKYLTAVENMYTLLSENEANQVLSVGFNDIFANASAYPNSISEPCDVIHWMRICYELFCLTGDGKYAESFEAAFYNPFLASVFANGKWGARGVRSAGRHMVATGQAGMKYSHCCVNNMPRGFMNAVDFAVMEYKNGLAVNLYGECEGEVGRFRIKIGEGYLSRGEVRIEIEAPETAEVSFRVPAWSESVSTKGKTFKNPGSRLNLKLRAGLNVFEIKFDMKPRVIEFPGEIEKFDKTDFRVARFVSGNNVRECDMVFDRRAVLRYGALLLCRSKLIQNSEEEMFGSESIAAKNLICEVEPVSPESVRKAAAVRNVFRVKFTGEGGFETLMCDYATGSNHWSEDDDRLFSIWL